MFEISSWGADRAMLMSWKNLLNMLYVYKLPIFSMVGLAIDDKREMLLSSSGENSGSTEHMYYAYTVKRFV